jgi:hypothetical protein
VVVVTALFNHYWDKDEDGTYDLAELRPDRIVHLSDSELWNQFVVFFMKNCCPGYDSSHKNRLLPKLKPVLARMKSIITRSAASQKSGGAVSQK